jgi:hypothetical protein
MEVFTEEFLSVLRMTEKRILQNESVHTDGSIANDDLKRLYSFIKSLDSEVNSIIDIVEEAEKVYPLKNTLQYKGFALW